ncbi:MAG: DDE-type integrase/transposase/recombinase [Candidatus Binatia bacterium]|nr:DDE-type integrase/transposase/recombinase [Candidatus Binatia bacterium]
MYRILTAHDLITSPAYALIRAADRFQHPTKRPNELWQTDFTYLRVVSWGWYYLLTVLDDDSRYILAWMLGTMMKASDVTETPPAAVSPPALRNISGVRPGFASPMCPPGVPVCE